MSTIEHVICTDSTADTIYAAVASPAGIHGWWAKNGTVGSKVGDTNELRFDKGGRVVVMTFRIDELSTNERVVWTCTDNANPVWIGTTLTFALTDAGLTLTHAGFAENESPPYHMTVKGWHHFVASLKSYIETGKGEPW